MSKKRVVKIEGVRFKNEWPRGPRIVIDHEGTDYNRGEALVTTSIDMKDEYAAMAILVAARDAVKYHRDQAANRLKMLNDALEDTR